MSPTRQTPTTHIGTSTPEDVFVRGRSLCRELIGRVSFTQMTYFQIIGRMPTAAETAVLDACLVTLVEHGLTPSVIASRLTYSSAPESMQAAVGAGLAGVGSVFVGTVEGCGALLDRMLTAGDAEAEARRIVAEHRAARKPVAGFGHPLHKPDDPRTLCIVRIAEDAGIAGKHIAALRLLAHAVDQGYGKHITINATGAVAAALGDCGVPKEIMRGFAILARCAGLVGHIHEEQRTPAMRALWEAGESAVPYDAEGPSRDAKG